MGKTSSDSSDHNSSRASFYIMLGMMALATSIYGAATQVTGEIRSTREAAAEKVAEIKPELEEFNDNHGNSNKHLEIALRRLDLWSRVNIGKHLDDAVEGALDEGNSSVEDALAEGKSSIEDALDEGNSSLEDFQEHTTDSVETFLKCPLGC